MGLLAHHMTGLAQRHDHVSCDRAGEDPDARQVALSCLQLYVIL